MNIKSLAVGDKVAIARQDHHRAVAAAWSLLERSAGQKNFAEAEKALGLIKMLSDNQKEA